MRGLLIATTALVAIAPATAAAQSMSDIEAIVTTLEGELAFIQAFLGDQIEVMLDGAIAAETTVDGIVVRYPALTVASDLEPASERVLFTVPAREVQADVVGDFVELAYDAPVRVTVDRQEGFDDMGGVIWDTVSSVDIEIDNLAGTQTLRVPDGWTMQTNAVASRVSIEPTAAVRRWTLDQVTYDQLSQQGVDALWDVQARSTATGITSAARGRPVIDAAAITAEAAIQGLNEDRLLPLARLFSDLYGLPDEVVTDAVVQKSLFSFLDLLVGSNPVAHTMAYQIEIDDARIIGSGQQVVEGSLFYEFGLAGLGAPEVEITTDVAMTASSTGLLGPPLTDLVPHTIRLSTVVQGLPLRAMMNDLEAAARDGLNPEPFLNDTIRGSAISLTIEEISATSGLTQIAIAGRIETAPSAMIGAVGTVDVSIAGLSDVIAMVQTWGWRNVDSVVAGLTVLQSMGREGVDPETGTPIREYRIELTAEGQLLINGADFLPMFRAL